MDFYWAAGRRDSRRQGWKGFPRTCQTVRPVFLCNPISVHILLLCPLMEGLHLVRLIENPWKSYAFDIDPAVSRYKSTDQMHDLPMVFSARCEPPAALWLHHATSMSTSRDVKQFSWCWFVRFFDIKWIKWQPVGSNIKWNGWGMHLFLRSWPRRNLLRFKLTLDLPVVCPPCSKYPTVRSKKNKERTNYEKNNMLLLCCADLGIWVKWNIMKYQTQGHVSITTVARRFQFSKVHGHNCCMVCPKVSFMWRIQFTAHNPRKVSSAWRKRQQKAPPQQPPFSKPPVLTKWNLWEGFASNVLTALRSVGAVGGFVWWNHRSLGPPGHHSPLLQHGLVQATNLRNSLAGLHPRFASFWVEACTTCHQKCRCGHGWVPWCSDAVVVFTLKRPNQ